MKHLVRLQLAILIMLLLFASMVIAQTVTVEPDSLPKNAYVNNSTDEHFIQCCQYVLSGTNSFAADTYFTITMPTGSEIQLADLDDDGSYNDEVYVTWTTSNNVTMWVSATNTSASGIRVRFTGAAMTYNTSDKFSVVFPVTTEQNPTDTTPTYTVAHSTGGDDQTVTVSLVDSLALVRFGANFRGGDVTNNLGKYYPTTATNLLSSALPDWITDATGNGNAGTAEPSDDNLSLATALDNDETTDEITYYFWASQTSALTKVSTVIGEGERVFSYSATSPTLIADNEDDQFNYRIDAGALAEGRWYFYVTSSITGDWVIGSSGYLDIRHYPVFNSSTGYGGGFDYDLDGFFEPGASGDDNNSPVYLESGGTLGIDGLIGGTNTDTVKIFWDVEDVDDNADVQIFLSTLSTFTADSIQTSGTSPNLVVTGLGSGSNAASKISSSTLYEENANRYYLYDIFTDSDTYEPAGSYYCYIVANDGKHQSLELIEKSDGTDVVLHVKHYPYLKLQDHYSSNLTFTTGDSQYFCINWGETVDGDKDADGTAIIKLYASDLNWAQAGGSLTSSSVDTTLLSDDAASDPDGTVLIATIVDSADTQEANRYMWDIRNSGLSAGTYGIYGVITQNGDALITRLNSSETIGNPGATQRVITIDHSKYFLAQSPVEGENVSLGLSDTYDLKWEAFDKDATSSNCLIQAFMAPASATIASTVNYTTAKDYSTANYFWLFPTTNGEDATNATTGTAASAGKYTLDVSAITTDMAGNADAPSSLGDGNYKVYYFFCNDGTFGVEEYVHEADGQLYFSEAADVTEDYNYTLQPTKATVEKGDTLTLSIYARDPGGSSSNNPKTLAIYLNVPSTNVYIIDQDTSTAGIQPFSETTTTFDGTIYENTIDSTSQTGYYQINFISMASSATNIATMSKVASFQVVVSGVTSGDVLENEIITFGTSGSRETHMVTAANGEIGKSVPSEASTLMLTPRGKITGFVDIEARSDSGQTVSFFVCPVGSYDCISDANFLSGNNDTDASDGIQVVLGANGSYALTNVPAGKYNIICKKDGWLQERRGVKTIQSYSTTTVDFNNQNKLRAGDCAGYDHDGSSSTLARPDNQISTADRDAINTAFNSGINDSDWNVYADFNGDSIIYLEDLNYYSANASAGNGDGIVYKNNSGGKYATNENAIARLVQTDESASEVSFAIEVKDLSNIHAYAVELFLDQSEWELLSYQDQIKNEIETAFIQKRDGSNYTFASAILGQAGIVKSDVRVITFNAKPLVADPSEPNIKLVTLIDNNHLSTKAILSSDLAKIPDEFQLHQNYPNPFNPSTTIKFGLPESGNVKLLVYNILGQEVRVLKSGMMEPGSYKIIWDGKDKYGNVVRSGMYLFQLKVDNKFLNTKKMIMLK